jgi:hypothetical protein
MADERATARPPGEFGAYGLRLANVARARRYLAPAKAAWPRLEIKRRVEEVETPREWLAETKALLRLQTGGEIRLDRQRGRATYVVPRRLRAAELVHPFLAPAAAVMAYWLGRECFHAGAFVAAGKAWGLIGGRGSGKSTTVAELALAGVPIVGDDLLVVQGRAVYAGPRAVDLRGDAAKRLGVGESLGLIGARERWRLPLPATRPEVPLGGWIFLAWGDRVETSRVSPAERVVRLHAGRGINLPPRDAEVMLELASLPAWELRRPRSWRSAGDALERLLETVA